MTTTDAQVQAAKLAAFRALSDLYAAKARKVESDMKAAQDERDRRLAKAMRRECARLEVIPGPHLTT